MAPIEMPKQTQTVQKLALQKQVKIPNANKFSLEKLINWNEDKLVKRLGKSHFIKEEGKLKLSRELSNKLLQMKETLQNIKKLYD